MLLRKINRKLAKLIPIFILVLGFFVFKDVLAANYWVTNPADCPSTNQTYYPGQNCDDLDICGTLSGNVAQCYDTSGMVAPSVTGTSDTIYTGSLPSGYILDCFATDSSVNGGYCSNNGDWWCNASSTCSDLNRETDCAANQVSVATCGGCSADAHACDGSFVDADGCEIQDGATCVSSDGLIGVYDNCNGAEGFCRINANYFETGVNVRYATSSSLIWGTQYGSGNLMELSASNTPGGIFTITNDGRVGIGTSTLGMNDMLTVGLDAGSQFIVSKDGVVTNGSWQAGIIGLAYGGTGLDLASSTGFLYLSNGTSTATSTIYIGNTDLAVANTGGSTLLSYIGNTISLATDGNWAGTVEGVDISLASSTWDTTTNTVNVNAGNWNSAYTAVSASSTSWTMAYDAITASSTDWNTAYLNRITSTSDNITFIGNTIGVTAGYNIPLTASTTNWNNIYDTVNANTWLSDLDFSSNGLMVRTANGAYASRTATGTDNQIVVTDGDGVSGNPIFGLASAVYLGASGSIGSDSNNYIDFSTVNKIGFKTNGVNNMTLDVNGYLGIGTTTPGARLDIKGIGTTTGIAFRTLDSTGKVNAKISDNGTVDLAVSDSSALTDIHLNATTKTSGNLLDFAVGGASKFSVAYTGSVIANNSIKLYGIGGSYPSYSVYTNSDTNWHGLFNSAYRSRGTLGAPSAAVNGDAIMYYDMWVHDGTSYDRGGQFKAVVDGVVSTGIRPIRWEWTTMDSVGVSATRLTIKNSGNVGIGTSSPSQMLTVGATSSQQFLVNNVGQVVGGTWMGSSIANSYIASSSNWNTTTDTVNASSTSWTMAYDAITASSTDWNTAYVNRITSAGAGLLIAGNTISADTDYIIPTIASTTAWNNVAASSWAVNGSDIYYNTGKVGIGTSTPGARLDISGDATTAQNFNLTNTATGGKRWNIGDGIASAGTFSFYNQTDSIGVLHLKSDGSVGIGTVSPMAKLHSAGITPMLMSTSDLVWGATGSVAQFEFGAASGNTYTKLETFVNGGSGYGNLALNSGGGNVGIGTTIPGKKLTVLGGDIALRADDDLTDAISMVSGTTEGYIYVNNAGSTKAFLSAHSSYDSYFSDNLAIGGTDSGTAKLYVNGNVGIGTTAPAYKLDVNGTFNATSVYSNGVLLSPGTGSNWSVNGADIYRSAGNVGIGVASPQAKLDVLGEIRNSGTNPIIRALSSGTGTGRLFMQVVDGTTPSGYLGTDAVGMPLAFTSGSNVEAMRILSNGNIGIGTTTSAQKLTVVGTSGSDILNIASSTGSSLLYINQAGLVGIGTAAPLRLLSLKGSVPVMRFEDTDAGGAVGEINVNNTSGSIIIDSDASNLAAGSYTSFQVDGAEKMRLDANGNLGLGITDPGTTKLYVTQGTTNAWAAVFKNTDSADSYGLTVRAGNDSADASFSIMDRTSTSTYMYVRGDGNVGFGIANPARPVVINGASTQGTLQITNSGSGVASSDGLLLYNVSGDAYLINQEAASLNFGVNSSVKMTILSGGNVGIGTAGPGYKLDIQGGTGVAADKINSRWGYLTNGADYAEYFYTDDTDLASGETVCIDVVKDNAIKRCDRGADNNVMGIVSTNPSIVGNGNGAERDNDPHYKIIGMLGQVPALVTNDNGPIYPGDSLTSASTTPGFLMRANAGDSTVGIALESFDASAGRINVLISRRNKSLTVETIESEVSERIAAMAIEDDVRLMIDTSLESLNVDDQIKAVVASELNIFDSRLTLKFDDISGQIANLETKYEGLDTRLSLLEDNVRSISDYLGQASTTLAQFQEQINLLDEKTISSIEIFDPFLNASTTVSIAEVIASHEVKIMNLQNDVALNRDNIAKVESKVLSVEDRVALLEGANSTTTDETALVDDVVTIDDSIFSTIISKLASLSIFISDKIIGVTNLIADMIDTREIKTNEIKVTKSDNQIDNAIGEGYIPAGATSTLIVSNKITNTSKLFVTFRGDYGSRWWIGDLQNGSSTLVIAEPLTADIYFDWWVVGINQVSVPEEISTVDTVVDSEIAPALDQEAVVESDQLVADVEAATTTEDILVPDIVATTSDLIVISETATTTTP